MARVRVGKIEGGPLARSQRYKGKTKKGPAEWGNSKPGREGGKGVARVYAAGGHGESPGMRSLFISGLPLVGSPIPLGAAVSDHASIEHHGRWGRERGGWRDPVALFM